MAPRTDFAPDYTPDFLPDGAASDGNATGLLDPAEVTLEAGTVTATGYQPPTYGGGGGRGARDYWPEEPTSTPGRATLRRADVRLTPATIRARAGATGATHGHHGAPTLTAGIVRARGVQNPGPDEILAILAALGDL